MAGQLLRLFGHSERPAGVRNPVCGETLVVLNVIVKLHHSLQLVLKLVRQPSLLLFNGFPPHLLHDGNSVSLPSLHWPHLLLLLLPLLVEFLDGGYSFRCDVLRNSSGGLLEIILGKLFF